MATRCVIRHLADVITNVTNAMEEVLEVTMEVPKRVGDVMDVISIGASYVCPRFQR